MKFSILFTLVTLQGLSPLALCHTGEGHEAPIWEIIITAEEGCHSTEEGTFTIKYYYPVTFILRFSQSLSVSVLTLLFDVSDFPLR